MAPDNLIRCSCGKLYAVYTHYCGNQSYCPSCQSERQKEYEIETVTTISRKEE